MDNLINLYKQRFALQNAVFAHIEHEDAIVAIVYKLSLPNGKEYILKICTRSGDYLCELYFLKYFADKLPVPRIIDQIEPEAGIHGAILMEYLSGSLLQITDVTDTIAHETGALLAKIHSNKAAGYGDLTQPHNLSPDPSFYFTFKFEEGLAECSNHLPKAMSEQCHRYYYEHVNILTSADGPCITHRDFRPGNVIVNGGKIEGIIDWSSARASFAEEDFCSLELGEWTYSSTIKQSFLAGYASIRAVPNYENVMPLLRLSKAIATIGFTIKSGTWEGKNSRLYQRNRQFLDEFISNNF